MAHPILSQQTYFQQEVNYKINVSLNDKKNTLSAVEEIQYINNSSQGLDVIYFHLWPNAYKNNNTALAKQLVKQNKTTFYFSQPEEKGSRRRACPRIASRGRGTGSAGPQAQRPPRGAAGYWGQTPISLQCKHCTPRASQRLGEFGL